MEPGHYYGIDPNQWLIDEGIRHELGKRLFESKRPVFSNDAEFNLSLFDRKFDFLMAQSISSHTSQSQMRKILSEAAKVMHDRSIFLATYIPGDSDYAGKEWSYPDGVSFTFNFVHKCAAEPNSNVRRSIGFTRSSNGWFSIAGLMAHSSTNA